MEKEYRCKYCGAKAIKYTDKCSYCYQKEKLIREIRARLLAAKRGVYSNAK